MVLKGLFPERLIYDFLVALCTMYTNHIIIMYADKALIFDYNKKQYQKIIKLSADQHSVRYNFIVYNIIDHNLNSWIRCVTSTVIIFPVQSLLLVFFDRL